MQKPGKESGAQATRLSYVYFLNLAITNSWEMTTTMMKNLYFWPQLEVSLVLTGPSFVSAENRVMLLVMNEDRGVLISLQGPGHRTGRWMA